MKKQIILEQYTKYLQAIKNCNVKEIPSKFQLFMDFLEKKLEPKDRFYLVMMTNTVFSTLSEANTNDLNFKEASSRWDSKAASECWTLVKQLESEREQCEGNVGTQNISDRFKILQYKVFQKIFEQNDPSLQLYMYNAFISTETGKTFFKSELRTIKKLLEATSEEEIEALLSPKEEEKKDFSSRFKCTKQIDKLKLFKMFNPKNLAETEERYLKLEEMADKGEISMEDYTYVRDILLSPRKHFYSRGGVYKEPSSKDELLKVIDGETFSDESHVEEIVSM